VVSALGLDEVAFQRANALGSSTSSQVAAAKWHDWLGTRTKDWRAGITTVAIDPFRGYANGVATHLSHATVVVDPFHAIALANRALDDVRRRVQNETLGHRGRTGDPLYGIRRLLLRATERHSEASRARLEAGLAAGDPRDEVLDALLAKEALRHFYAANDLDEATVRFDAFITECQASKVPELGRLARTAKRWRKEILAHHATGASNGPTEAVNLVVKKVSRVAHGFRSFDNFRLRVLLHCGVKWHTLPAARIRGRSPRLAA
jgi:transposase